MKKISILGSTGSIGKSTIDVIKNHPDKFRIVGLAARNNVVLLEEQIRFFKPEIAAVYDDEAAETLRRKKLPVEILSGEDGIIRVATHAEADTVVSAIVGSAGLVPTHEAIKSGKDIALATKEALVMAGSIIMNEAAKKNVRILPVDSEHSAVFQCLHGRDMNEVDKVVLTASGGPFLGKDIAELDSVTPEDALKHPTWDMGRKISIDSATLMNKGLEVIEACWLFDLPPEKVEVILHPQSIVHCMVKFVDGSMIAHMSVPDMKGPISYALSYPERFGGVIPKVDLAEVRDLTFFRPDEKKYPALQLTYAALRAGGTMPCVMNAANEIAVEAFLESKIAFTSITRVVSMTMTAHKVQKTDSIDTVISSSGWAKETAKDIVENSELRIQN
ncbi:MAG: 1-deoxy-D-xylulose-5-phosphate reductoisomerase [Nitrospiraceae bacterium]|nr:MAG: 1-deoxy-D-xylulose-5-phosphate reductoisomerase [Nitrospiraceae bacterium]